MKLDPAHLAARNFRGPIGGWPRIILAKYADTPAETGYGSSRFSSPTDSFKVLYAASTFRAAFAEAVVRDRLVGKHRRYLYRPHLEERMVTEIRSIADLHLLNLTGGATYELGIDSDTTRATKHDKGQEFAEALYADTLFDGILYDSRINADTCVAIFERAFTRIDGSTPIELLRAPGLVPELSRLGITVRARRGTGP